MSCASDGGAITGCFANYCDWRLPSIAEFKGIINLGQVGCGTDTGTCIDPIFGPTQFGYAKYWTATTAEGNSDNAWSVMGYGTVYNLNKTSNNLYLRAVRSGSCR